MFEKKNEKDFQFKSREDQYNNSVARFNDESNNEEEDAQSKVVSDINNIIDNPQSNVKSDKGFEIITEAMVQKINEIFGRNSLLSMLYQVGLGPGQAIAKRIQEKYNRTEFGIMEALELLLLEIKDFYSIKVQDIELSKDKVKIVIENHCFLRKPIKSRKTLEFGKSFCRVNKGYFETAFKMLVGKEIVKVDMMFIENDEEKDACIEEITFYLNSNSV